MPLCFKRFGLPRAAFFVLLCSASLAGYGQTNTSTFGNYPLSRLGFGYRASEGTVRNQSMGGTGVANPSTDYINIQNPALLQYNKATNFDAGLLLNRFTIRDNSGNFSTWGGGPQYLLFSFPVAKRVTLAAGLMPYTYVDYDLVVTNQATSSAIATSTNTYRGDGGLSKILISGGYYLGEGISLGLESGYVFGTIEKDLSVQLVTNSTGNSTFSGRLERGAYRQLVFKPGLAYRYLLDSVSNTVLNLGAALQLNSQLRSDVSIYSESRLDQNSAISQDTVLERKDKQSLPGTLTIGAGLNRINKWSLALDLSYENYGNYTYFTEPTITYTNGYKASLGGEWIPKIASTNYLKKIRYRAGLSLHATPYQVNGQQLLDRQLSFGVGLPMTRKEAKFTRPYVNLALVTGIQGSLATNDYRDTYWRMSLSLNLNDLTWFSRYRVE
jgi:hypothetical protein